MQISWNKEVFLYISKEFNSHRIGLIHQNGRCSIVWYTNMAAAMSCEKDLRQASSNYRRCGNTLNFKMTNLDLKYLLIVKAVANVSRLPTAVKEVK